MEKPPVTELEKDGFLEGETVEVCFSDDEPPDDDDPNDELPEASGEGDNECMEDGDETVNDTSAWTLQHSDSVMACVFRNSAEGIEICTGGMDDIGLCWDIQSDSQEGVLKSRLEGHTDSIVTIAYSHDGQYVATASMDGTCKIWNSDSGTLVSTCEGPSQELEWCAWHPKGHVIAAGSTDMTVWMWWAPTGKVMQVFGGHGGAVGSGSFSPDGKAIVSGAEDGGVIIWNPKDGTSTHNLGNWHRSPVVQICAYPNESRNVVLTCAEGSCKVLAVETGRQLHAFGGHEENVEAIGFSHPDAVLPLLATGDLSGKLGIWDALNYESRVSITKAHDEGIIALRWVRDTSMGHLLVTCSNDATSKLWDGRSGSCLNTFIGHRLPVLSVDVRLHGSELLVASCSDDETCKIFRHVLNS